MFESHTHNYYVYTAEDERGIAIVIVGVSGENQPTDLMAEAYFVRRPDGDISATGFKTTYELIDGRNAREALLAAASMWAANQARASGTGHSSLSVEGNDPLDAQGYERFLFELELEFRGSLALLKRWRSDNAGNALIDEVTEKVGRIVSLDLALDEPVD